MICAVLSIVRCLIGQMILACDTPPWNMHALPFHSTFCKKAQRISARKFSFPADIVIISLYALLLYQPLNAFAFIDFSRVND